MNPPPSEPSGRLTELSLRRRVTVLVLVLATLVVGLMAGSSIELELFPSGFTAPFLSVWVPWGDAPAQEALDRIVLPLEEEISTVRGIQSIRATATRGSGSFFLTFRRGTDMAVAYREVRDRIERARPRLPADADRIYLRKHDATGIPIFVVGVAVDAQIADPYDLVQRQLITPLTRLDGVAAVQADGLQQREILIELDRDRTAASGLNVYSLAQQLGDDNFTLASGDVRMGGSKLALRSLSRFRSLEEVEERLVAPGLRLRDVATVSYRVPDRTFNVRAMSQPALALIIFKEGQANAVETARRIEEELERMQADPRLAGLDMMTIFDQGAAIRESLRTLLTSGMIGGTFAALVLFFFLRRFRMTLIIALAIPMSLLVAVTVMYFTGESLNILTLLALMMSVGLLVDNSVVVGENIHRLHRDGLSRREAAVRGAAEISLAIVTATLTTIIVFLPAALVEGEGQFFLMRLALPITVALLASLLVALLLIPLSVYLTLPGGEAGGAQRSRNVFVRALRAVYEATFGRLNRLYGRLLDLVLGRRFELVLGLLVVLLVTGAVASQRVQITAIQEDEQTGFQVRVDLPPTTLFEEAEEYFLAAERVVEEMQEELELDGYLIVHGKISGRIEGWLRTSPPSSLTPRQVTERLMEALPERGGVRLYSGQAPEADERERQSTYALRLSGDDWETLERVAADLEPLLASVDGVLGVRQAGETMPNELGLVVDRELAQRQGINPQVVAGVVGYALRGQMLPKYRDEGREIPVRIRFQESDREGLTELLDFSVPTAAGDLLPLAVVTDSSLLDAPRRIQRVDKRLARTITVDLEEGREEETRTRLAALTSRLDLPEGVQAGPTAAAVGAGEDMAAMLFAAMLSIVFVYLLMGFLFESFVLPLSIVTSVPLASIGVVWIHALVGRNIDFLGVVGLILLIGVVVNNGIVLIDYVNRLRARGLGRREAILTAADRRFRPIMMTALTTICGMVPLAVRGTSSIGISYTSFGLTLIGGLVTASLLTLLVVPVFYTLFDDARRAVRETLLGRPAAEPSPLD